MSSRASSPTRTTAPTISEAKCIRTVLATSCSATPGTARWDRSCADSRTRLRLGKHLGERVGFARPEQTELNAHLVRLHPTNDPGQRAHPLRALELHIDGHVG